MYFSNYKCLAPTPITLTKGDTKLIYPSGDNLPTEVSITDGNVSYSSSMTNTHRASLVAQTVENLPAMQETQVQFLNQEDPLEKGMATYSSILAWRIPWTERSLAGCSRWGCKETDTTERLTCFHTEPKQIAENHGINKSAYFL